MKKNKKEKLNKKKEGMPQSKWRPWMTILGSIGGVGVVVGATILGIFATGGFNEKVVPPESIAFDYGDMSFNELYSQIEIADSENKREFYLTITSPTSDVTAKEVELSFANEKVITTTGDLISNSIIKVPQVAMIGQPFKVEILTELLEIDDNEDGPIDETIDWVKGGVSTLVAKSKYAEIDAINLKIAIDTPVYKTQTMVFDSTGRQVSINADKQFAVYANEKFDIQSKFIPAKSEYMYGDDCDVNDILEENRRKKHTFFGVGTSQGAANSVSVVYEDAYNLYFLANKEYKDAVTINSYTFAHANEENEFVDSYAEEMNSAFYIAAYAHLAGKSTGVESFETKILVGHAEPSSFALNGQNNISVLFDKTTTLYMNYNSQEATSPYIGALVKAGERQLDNLLKNVGISFSYIKNGEIVDAVGDGKAIIIEGSKSITYNGKTYYLPN